MSIFNRIFGSKQQVRTTESLGLISLLNQSRGTGKFVAVTSKKSISLGVVFECIDVISRTLSLVNPKVIELRDNGKFIDNKYKYNKILTKQPYPLYNSTKLYEKLICDYLLFGNGYARILRNNIGTITGLKYIEPSMVEPQIIEIDGIEEHWYKIEGVNSLVNQKDMIHVMDFSFDGIKGISRIMTKKHTIGNAGNIQSYAMDMYENGAYISGYIYGDATIGKDALNYLRQKFEELYTSKTGGIAALPSGFKYEPLKYNLPFADAQIIEAQKFAVEDIARIFGVPLSLIGRGDSADNKADREYNTFLSNVIAPITILLENEINRKVVTEDNKYLKFELKGLFRTDMLVRYQAHQIAINAGFMNKDEVRNVENMNPIPGGLGETYYQPLNTIPLQKAEDYFDSIIDNDKSKEVNNDNTGI